MEFDLQDASSVSNLLMKLKYDNGFIAHINGVEVARDGNTLMIGAHDDGSAGKTLADIIVGVTGHFQLQTRGREGAQ